MIRKSLAILAVCVGIQGCATTYSSAGLTGGHAQAPVNERLIKVYFSGNGYITADRVKTFALYRCAELARDAKKPYFTLYDSLLAAARDVPSKQPGVGTLGGKPLAFAFMALEDGPRPGAQEVNAVLAALAPLVKPDAGSVGAQR